MAPKSDQKIYLGDGAYAEFDGFSVHLTTENGITTQNRVVLEPQCLEAFLRWLPQFYNREQLIKLISRGDTHE